MQKCHDTYAHHWSFSGKLIYDAYTRLWSVKVNLINQKARCNPWPSSLECIKISDPQLQNAVKEYFRSSSLEFSERIRNFRSSYLEGSERIRISSNIQNAVKRINFRSSSLEFSERIRNFPSLNLECSEKIKISSNLGCGIRFSSNLEAVKGSEISYLQVQNTVK